MFYNSCLYCTQYFVSISIIKSIHQVITERELEVNVKVEGSDPVTMKFMNTDAVKKIAERLQEMNLVENSHPRIFVSS